MMTVNPMTRSAAVEPAPRGDRNSLANAPSTMPLHTLAGGKRFRRRRDHGFLPCTIIPGPPPMTAPYKIPRSVLVVIHTPELQVLMMERAGWQGFWQSVTGSLAHESEPLRD